jgi:hypothetical protein
MRAIEDLPPAFGRFRQIGGVLDFVVFDDAQGDEWSALTAIATALPDMDVNKLRRLGYRRVEQQAFYGDWYDARADALLRLGTFTTVDGRKLTDPKLSDLDKEAIAHGGSSIPEAGAGGQFAYAFSQTPYGLAARPSEIQDLFRSIRDFVLPPETEHEILDWTSPRLPNASKYFAAGMEWWGVFLFTVHAPALGRLTVISGSTTD